MKAGNLGIAALVLALVPVLSNVASAQSTPTQQIIFARNGTNSTGWTYCYCCYCAPDYRTPISVGDGLTLGPWNDAIGYSYVRITIECRWGINQAGASTYTVHLNGTGTGNQIGTAPSMNAIASCATPGSCTTTTYPSEGGAGSYSIDLQPGNSIYNVGGTNSIRFVNTSGNYCQGLTDGPADGSSGPWMVRITVTGLNQSPFVPANLTQIGPDGKTIPVGGICAGSTMRLRATVTDPDNDDCSLEAEFQPNSFFFLQTPTHFGNPAPAGQDAFIDITSLAPGGYHWQARSKDSFDFTSSWASYGGNSEITADAIVDSAVKPPPPLDGKNHGGGDCDISVAAAGGLLSPALFGLALLGFAAGRRRK